MRNGQGVQGFILWSAGLLAGLSAGQAGAATITAASCQQAAVQAAVNSASDGDIVALPNGACSWSAGIATTKQIRIQAQNYTPTPGGTMTRSVTITNNSSSPLFKMQSGNNYHVGVGGIRFNEGTGTASHVRFEGSGSKVPLLYDCAFEHKERFGTSDEVGIISFQSLGAVAWNIFVDGSNFRQASMMQARRWDLLA